jgi:hypothetical protein
MQPKKFFPVVDGEGVAGKEGVVWQDPATLKIFVTWLSLSLDSAETFELPSAGNTYLTAVASNGLQVKNTSGTGADLKKHPEMIASMLTVEIVYIVEGTTRNPDLVSPLAVTVTKVNRIGAVLLQVGMNTGVSDGGLNIQAHSSSGASFEWDVPGNQLGLIIARTMKKGADGLNHQGAIAVIIAADTLELVKNYGQTSGHSFVRATFCF